MTTEALIKPATIQEQLLGKISDMRQERLKINQIENEKSRRDNLKIAVKQRFEYLTERYFKIGVDQIRKLSDQELEILLVLTHERAEKIMARRRVISFSVIGWVLIILGVIGWDEKAFLKEVCELKLILGNKYNPVAIIRNQA